MRRNCRTGKETKKVLKIFDARFQPTLELFTISRFSRFPVGVFRVISPTLFFQQGDSAVETPIKSLASAGSPVTEISQPRFRPEVTSPMVLRIENALLIAFEPGFLKLLVLPD